MPRNLPGLHLPGRSQRQAARFSDGRSQRWDDQPLAVESLLATGNGHSTGESHAARPRKRATYTWTKEARDLVRSHMNGGSSLHKLITELSNISGHPRRVCVRFARRLGFEGGRSYKEWSEQEIDEIKRSYTRFTPRILAARLQRPEASVRAMFTRLGITMSMKQDQFTKYTLAVLLHVRPQVVQDWIDKGWLKYHLEGTKRLPRVIVKAQDVVVFCELHHKDILGRRVNDARLEFIQMFMCPPDRKRRRVTDRRPMDEKRMDEKKKPASGVTTETKTVRKAARAS